MHLKIPRGTLVAVVGRIGCGKSAFAQALIGEMRPTTGKVIFGGSVSYFQQSPWVQSCSVRDNILFGADEDTDRLQQAVQACALKQDIEMLDDGIDTEVGERGVSTLFQSRSRQSVTIFTLFHALPFR